MATVEHTAVVDDEGLASYLQPRHRLVEERATGDGCYESVGGPFHHYQRQIEVEPASGEPGRHRVQETTTFEVAAPIWSFLYTSMYKRSFRKRVPETDDPPFWLPPDRFDARSSTVLAVLCTLSLLAGYLGTLITQTMTYAAEEFGATTTQQSGTLAAVRVGVLGSLVLAAMADRRGRRKILLLAGAGAVLAAAAGAFAPNLVVLGMTQTVSRGFSSAFALLITVIAAEEMPAGSRAYAVSVIAMTAGLGAGICLWFLPVIDLDERAWRLLYLAPLLGVLVLRHGARHLPESKRFVAPHAERPRGSHAKRLALLAGTAFLIAAYSSPASQLQNEFLKTERDYLAWQISVFSLTTGTLGVFGVVVGGRLADTRGRRGVAAFAVIVGSAFTTLAYLNSGALLWIYGAAGFIIGAAAVPSLGVYGPELFPTVQRGRANGIINIVAVTGSAVGLLIAGIVADQVSLGRAMTYLLVGPVLVGIIVLAWYPETAHRELEELNPEDGAPPAAASMPLPG